MRFIVKRLASGKKHIFMICYNMMLWRSYPFPQIPTSAQATLARMAASVSTRLTAMSATVCLALQERIVKQVIQIRLDVLIHVCIYIF